VNHSQQVSSRRLRVSSTRRPKPVSITSPRQSPITDIRTLTRLVFESYQHSYAQSSPKVQRRYKKLIHDLAESKTS